MRASDLESIPELFGFAFQFDCEFPQRGRERLPNVVARLNDLRPAESMLVTNLGLSDLSNLDLGKHWRQSRALAGIHEDSIWLLVGPVAQEPPVEWSNRRAVPLAMSALQAIPQ